MKKVDIIQSVHEKLGIPKADSTRLVESVFEVMKETLATGEGIKISGFGNLTVRDKNARRGRNPQTGETIEIEARRVLTFKASNVLKKALND